MSTRLVTYGPVSEYTKECDGMSSALWPVDRRMFPRRRLFRTKASVDDLYDVFFKRCWRIAIPGLFLLVVGLCLSSARTVADPRNPDCARANGNLLTGGGTPVCGQVIEEAFQTQLQTSTRSMIFDHPPASDGRASKVGSSQASAIPLRHQLLDAITLTPLRFSSDM